MTYVYMHDCCEFSLELSTYCLIDITFYSFFKVLLKNVNFEREKKFSL